MEFYQVLMPAALVLLVSKLLMKVCEKINLPSVVGLLVAGLLVGLINYIPGQDILTPTSLEGIGFFAQVGVILIMFSVGLETNVQQIKEIGGPAVIITLAGVIVPMVLAFLVSVWCTGGFANMTQERLLAAIFYGAISTATSVSVTVATLKELGKLNTKVGNTIVAAAILDDIIGIIATESTFCAAAYAATAVGPRLLSATCRMIAPMAMIEDWNPIGRPIFKCSFSTDQLTCQSSRCVCSAGTFRRI